MALSRIKTWIADEVLSASNLNAEFNNILNNALSLISPLTGALDFDGKELILDADGDSSITVDTDDVLHIRLQGQDLFIFDGDTASAVDGFTFNAVATASPSSPSITAQGSSTNINLNLVAKGSGKVQAGGANVLLNVVEDTTPQLGGNLDLNTKEIVDTNGNEVFTHTATGSALNQAHFTNAATTDPAIITAEGETNVGLHIFAKGTGTLQLGDANLVWPDSDGSANESLVTNGSGTLGFANTTVAQADQAAIEAETNENTYIPPDLLNFAPGVAKGWVQFDISAVVQASHNVTTVTDTAAGDWTVNWVTDFSGADYAFLGTAFTTTDVQRTITARAQAAGTTETNCYDAAGAKSEANMSDIYVVAFGDQA